MLPHKKGWNVQALQITVVSTVREALQKAVDKVGNSAAAVRKELGLKDASQS